MRKPPPGCHLAFTLLLAACSGNEETLVGEAATTGGSSSGGLSGTAGATSSGGANTAVQGGTTSAGGTRPTGGTSSGTWQSGYTATMFGNVSAQNTDCYGYSNFSDSTNITSANCTWLSGSLKVTIAGYQSGTPNNARYYGAPGDLSSIWQGGQCTCQGGGTGNCTSAPSCSDEQDCAKCVAVRCDPSGPSVNGTSHGSYCDTTTYVVVQIIDACPHNHPTNVASTIGWCTSRRANHIDVSCSALGGISTLGTNIGQQGWLPVAVQMVDCSVGLGPHAL